MELTKRKSFRKSKSSFKEVVGGREFFFTSTKSIKNTVEVYDIESGILVMCTARNMNYAKAWVEQNIERIEERLKPYVYQEPNLFS